MYCSFVLLLFCRQTTFEEYPLPPEEFSFDVRIEVENRRVLRYLQSRLSEYKESHHGPTVVLVQAKTGQCYLSLFLDVWFVGINELRQSIPVLDQFPVITIPSLDR